ncbi:uncharacterized protein BDW70DRAFT_131185 [Aspergillus foveolatus]|uniref:uncharacterized protein n=1 Tax=Aspergillus foveolatus TaxID=210207 RepID=UPI003CCCED14
MKPSSLDSKRQDPVHLQPSPYSSNSDPLEVGSGGSGPVENQIGVDKIPTPISF